MADSCETSETCEVIGKAIINTNFKIGCNPCPIPPIFDPEARISSGGKVKLYKDKLRNLDLN